MFHSLHASIYYAIWYGLFDTLQVLCQKLELLQSFDLVAAELDYPVMDFTRQIVDSIKAYAEKLEATVGSSGESDAQTYTAAPCNFTDDKMKARYAAFLGGLRIFI